MIERGSFYIDLHIEPKNPMKGLINIKNYYKKCLYYNHLYHVYNQEIWTDPHRQSKYKKYGDKLNYADITFPVTIRQMNKIENNNNIRIHAFGCENKSVFPCYISKCFF